MYVKNKTNAYQICAGIPARPWRLIEVPDGSAVDLSKFEIVGESKAKSPANATKKKGSE